MVTLMDKLNGENLSEKIGASYLASLEEIVPSTQNIEEYCRIVSEKASLRDMIVNFGNIISECYEDKKPLMEIIDRAQGYICLLYTSNPPRSKRRISAGRRL